MYIQIAFLSPVNVYGDSTGRFLVTSTSGIKYIIIIYDHDSNIIHA